MKLSFIFLKKLASEVTKSVERRAWNIPGKKKKKQIKLSAYIQPQELYQRLLNAPIKSYYWVIGIVFGFGVSGVLAQLISHQKSLHTEKYVTSAVQILEENKALMNIIGVPYKLGLVTPITENGIQQDSVNIFIKVEGKKTEGIIACYAELNGDTWDVKKLEFRFADKAGGVVRLKDH